MRLVFEPIDWVKEMALPRVQGFHPIHQGPQQSKKAEEGRLCSFRLWALGQWSFPALWWELTPPLFLVLRPLDLSWNYTTSFLGLQLADSKPIMMILGFHNSMSQFHLSTYLPIHLSIYSFIYLSIYLSTYLYLLLVLFLWRSMTNRNRDICIAQNLKYLLSSFTKMLVEEFPLWLSRNEPDKEWIFFFWLYMWKFLGQE